MKKYIISCFFILICISTYSQISYPQTLNFKQKIITINYIDNKGEKQHKRLSVTQGDYKIVFERATKKEWSPIMEIYGDKDQKGYFAFAKRSENEQIGEKIYEVNVFFSTETNNGVYVALSFDKSNIILYYHDKIVEYVK